MPLIKLQKDYKPAAWRIADNFLELPKDRRTELATLIEKELEYCAEKAAHSLEHPAPPKGGQMPLNRAHLVVKVDGKRPVSVVVMVGQTMVAELTIEELKRMYFQIDRMEDHLHDGIEQADR